jgi:two-component system LytT family response regulator
MITAILVDDEENCVDILRTLLLKYCPQIELLGAANGVQSGFKMINELKPEVVFLDIQMKDGTGFDLLEKIQDVKFHLIFTTSFDNYAVKAFKYSALDYLLKPINPEELIMAVARLGERTRLEDLESQVKLLLNNRNGLERLALPTSDGLRFVRTEEIVRCESEGNYTNVFLMSREKILVSRTMKMYAEIMPDNLFFRVHKSHLINLMHVKQYSTVDGGYVLMNDGSKVEISTRKKDEFLKWMLSNNAKPIN